MEKNAKIYVAGHRGMVGSAMVRRLQAEGYNTIITRTSKELEKQIDELVYKLYDLTDEEVRIVEESSKK